MKIRCFRANEDLKCLYELKLSKVFESGDVRELDMDKDETIAYGLHEKHNGQLENCQYIYIGDSKSLDVSIALPGPLGEFAFYGILENVIRNAAKYNKKGESGKPLEIRIIFSESKETENYRVLIYDNLSEVKDVSKNSKITNSKSYCDFTKIKKWLTDKDKDIIDNKGKVRDEAWGLAEIMVCGHLLYGSNSFKPDENIVNLKEYHDPWDKYIAKNKKNPPKRLIYEFQVPKAKNAVLIGKYFWEKTDASLRKQFYDLGILVCDHLDKFIEQYLKNKGSRNPFTFVIIEENSPNLTKILDENRQFLSYRIIRIKNEEGNSKEKNVDLSTGDIICSFNPLKKITDWNNVDQIDQIMAVLWETWSFRWHEDENISLHIYLNQKQNDFPTESWAKYAHQFNQNEEHHLDIKIWANDLESKYNKTSNNIIFDRHGLLKSKFTSIKENDTYILFDKQNHDFTRIFSPTFPQNTEPWLFPYQLLEASQIKILILDERITERSVKTIDIGQKMKPSEKDSLTGNSEFIPSYWHALEKANIISVTHIRLSKAEKEEVIVLHRQSFSEQNNRLKKSRNQGDNNKLIACPLFELDITNDNPAFRMNQLGGVNKEIKGSLASLKIDLIIIHEGIFDILSSMNRNEFLDPLRKKIPWIIIESGRGKPIEMRKGHNKDKFLPYSVIDYLVRGSRIAKLGLCELIMGCVQYEEKPPWEKN